LIKTTANITFKTAIIQFNHRLWNLLFC